MPDAETSDRVWGVGGWEECDRPECLDHYGKPTHHSVRFHDFPSVSAQEEP